MPTVDQVCARLLAAGKTTTYGAIADLCGGIARGVMAPYARQPLYSVVVTKSTRLPTGYVRQQIAPFVLARARPLMTAGELASFLRSGA